MEVDADIRGFATDEVSSDSDEYYSEDMGDEFVGSEEDSDYSEDDDTSDGMVKYLNTSHIFNQTASHTETIAPASLYTLYYNVIDARV